MHSWSQLACIMNLWQHIHSSLLFLEVTHPPRLGVPFYPTHSLTLSINFQGFLSWLDNCVNFHLSQYFLGGKIGGINLEGHFGSWSKFGNLCPKNHLKYFESILRHQMTLFYAPNLTGEKYYVFYTQIPFQRWNNFLNRSSYAKVMPLASWPIVLTTMLQEDATLAPVTHAYEASHARNLKKNLEGPKLYHNLRLRKSKP